MIPRILDLASLLDYRQSAFLFGPRGTGKSLLSRSYLEGAPARLDIDLLRSDDYLRFLREPWRLRLEVEAAVASASQALVVLIDEVQKVPILLDEVHGCLERHPGKLSFLLTGSSARKLKRQQANLLAGRALNLSLHPLSHAESQVPLERALSLGTLPVVWNAPEPRGLLQAYVSTYLKEEILQEALVRRVEVFSRFLELAAQLNGEPINFSKTSKHCGVSLKTAQEYYEILLDTLIVTRVDGWSGSVARQLLQQPKFYFFDCGVINALTGELQPANPSSFRYGRLFETWILQEMVRASHYHGLELKFNYWKTHHGREVDFVLSRTFHRPLAAIEIKYGSAPDESDLSGLQAFAQDYPEVPQYCFCGTPRPYFLGKVQVLPWQSLSEVLRCLG